MAGVGAEPLQSMNVRKPVLAPLLPEHLTQVRALDQRALGGFWTAAQWQTELAEPRRPGLGLWIDSALVAMASGWLVVDELHITVLATDPARRRQGHARQVLAALLQLAAAEGAERATLEVAAGNVAAVALYAGLGFSAAGIRRAYYRNGDDALIQWRRLAATPPKSR
jgi:ribosomal-protein-alanine N-acetyltransferase